MTEREPEGLTPGLRFIAYPMLFWFIGCPVGYLVFVIAAMLTSAFQGGDFAVGSIVSGLFIVLITAPLSLVFGALPAVATGLVAATTRRLTKNPILYVGICGLSGAGLTRLLNWEHDRTAEIGLPIVGMAAATFCGWLSRPRGTLLTSPKSEAQ